MTRAERIVEELGADVPVAARGMLLIPAAIAAVHGGDAETAREVADQIDHHRHRGGRARSARLRSAHRRPGGAGRGRHRAEHAHVRRGDGERHDGRRLADPGGDHLLRGGRRLRRGVRPTAGRRVDRGAAALVRRPARPRPVPRPVHGPPVTGSPRPGVLGRARPPKPNWPASDWPTPSTLRSASPTTSGASCTACAASWMPPPTRTARRAGTGTTPSPASRCCGWREGDVDGAVRAARRMLDEHGTGPARSGLLRGRGRGAAGGGRHRRGA